MRALAIAAVAGLAGCVSLQTAVQSRVDGFRPYVMDLTNGPQYEADRAKCLEVAHDYSTPLSAGSIVSAGGEGAANNAAAAAINPLVAAAGAAGAAGAETIKELGLDSADELKVFAWCMRDKGAADHAYDVVDPHL